MRRSYRRSYRGRRSFRPRKRGRRSFGISMSRGGIRL